MGTQAQWGPRKRPEEGTNYSGIPELLVPWLGGSTEYIYIIRLYLAVYLEECEEDRKKAGRQPEEGQHLPVLSDDRYLSRCNMMVRLYAVSRFD